MRHPSRKENLLSREVTLSKGAWLAAIALAAGAALAAFYLVRTWPGPGVNAKPIEQPADLETRARLFCDAWQRGDGPQVLRLSEPSFIVAVRKWLQRSTPPPQVISVSVELLDDSSAQVTIHTEAGPIQQRWVQRGGAWYFVPDTSKGP